MMIFVFLFRPSLHVSNSPTMAMDPMNTLASSSQTSPQKSELKNGIKNQQNHKCKQKSQKQTQSTFRRMSKSLTRTSSSVRMRKRRTVAKIDQNCTPKMRTPSSPFSTQNGGLRYEIEEEILDEESEKSKSSFERFCDCTSLHGWKYLSSNVNIALRIGWVAVVLGSMGVAGFFLGYSCNNFLSSTVQTTQDTSR